MSKVLSSVIAEDDADLLEGIKTLLESMDIRVVAEAGNGREAVARYQEHNPDFLLMDFYMPEMNGLQALREILAQDPEARVIMLSGVPGPGNTVIDDCLMAGAVDWIRKDLGFEGIEKQLAGIVLKHFSR